MTIDGGAPGGSTGATEAPTPAAVMAGLGRNEQLLIAGGAVVALANILGVVMSDWSLDLRAWVMILGGLAAAGLAFVPGTKGVLGIPFRSSIRIDAALVGAFAVVDLGDTLSSLGDWAVLDIVLTLLEVAAAAVLAYAAWAHTKGSLTADLAGLVGIQRLGLADGLLVAGAVGVIVAWFLLMAIADIFNFTLLPQVSVLAAMLVLVGRWFHRNPDAGGPPWPYAWYAVGLGAVSVLAGLAWLANVIGRSFEVGDVTTFVPMLLYVLALAALGFGAFLGIGRLPSSPPAA